MPWILFTIQNLQDFLSVQIKAMVSIDECHLSHLTSTLHLLDQLVYIQPFKDRGEKKKHDVGKWESSKNIAKSPLLLS